MDINADKIRLQFDGLELHFDRNVGAEKRAGWSVKRDDSFIITMVMWEEAFAVLTLHERVRCFVFANQLR